MEAKLSNNASVYIIQNHGIVTLGKTLDRAIFNAEFLEKTAHIYYMALSSGKPVTVLLESIVERIEAMRKSEV